jgi:hypothetical protein
LGQGRNGRRAGQKRLRDDEEEAEEVSYIDETKLFCNESSNQIL